MIRGIIGSEGHLGATTPLESSGQSLGLEIIMTFILMFVITSVSSDSRSVSSLLMLLPGSLTKDDVTDSLAFSRLEHWQDWLLEEQLVLIYSLLGKQNFELHQRPPAHPS